MESDSVTPFDNQAGSWSRTLALERFTSTCLLLIAAGVFWIKWVHVPQYLNMFENMVSGGKAALPKLTVMVIDHHTELIVLAAVIVLSALVYVLRVGHTVARMMIISTVAALLLFGGAYVIHLAMNQPLQTIMDHFNG